MPLSRLENFLKNVEGNIIYVNPDDLDATDSIENQGNSLTRPFKTIQRALLEASRFSYQIGENNDKFDRTTILLYPGTHEVDNRPGYNVVVNPSNAAQAQFRDRLGNVKTDLSELTSTSNYNLEDPANDLYKFNSVEGGVIVPRGVSVAGYDVRKTKIRPKFVPDPENLAVTTSAMFRLTGACHFWALSFFDANAKGSCYKDYTTDKYSPNFSHHKLTVFEYADGVNGVGIGTSTTTTDLSMYFHKIQHAFGDQSGRPVGDFPVTTDMQPSLPEYEMVGPIFADNIGISSIRAGTGANPSTTVTVTTAKKHGLVVDSAIRIAGVTTYPDIYNGNFIVSGVTNDTSFTVQAPGTPANGLPTIGGTEVIIADTDNVMGSSPYIFHCSMRSAYGMCGLHADGSKSAGFKSMLVAQFTGVSLQKDNNAFVLYNKVSGQYDDNATAPTSAKPLYLNGDAIYKPAYKNAHIKSTNSAFVQAVSVFVVGYANHFYTDNGGDMSITNSNSNFGSRSLAAKGYRDAAFAKDNRGYITHIIPPQNQFKKDINIEWNAINVTKTVGVSSSPSKVYIDGFTDPAVPPAHVIAGYRLGAKNQPANPDLLHVSIAGVGTVTTPIRMINKDGSSGEVSVKEYEVNRTGLNNSISSSVLTLRSNHQLYAGESIRVISDDGFLPDGLETGQVYYAVTNDSTGETLNANQIKIARSKNDALLGGAGNFITINNSQGGVLRVSSRVSDKVPGDLGHPIQYEASKSNWYVKGGTSNELFTQIAANSGALGPRTGKSFIKRKEDNRTLNDKLYRLRYVIPKESSDARPPIPGYVIQESGTVGVKTSSEFTNAIPDVTIQRNLRILKSVDRDPNTGIATVVTEKPHNLIVGDDVKLRNVVTSGNASGDTDKGYNIVTKVVGVSSSKGFELNFYGNNPGAFDDDISVRSDNLPTVTRQDHKDTFTVYRAETVKAHEYQRQDGVYYLICIDSSISPGINEFKDDRYNQNITDLYPQFDADNFTMDPEQATSYAINKPVGKVVTNDLRKSLTKEFTNNFLVGNRVGYAISYAEGSTAGITTVYTNVEHNLNTIISVGSLTEGSGYGWSGISTTLYNVHLAGGSGKGATANVVVGTDQKVDSVTIVDGGSGYTVGNTLTLRGPNGASNSTVQVTAINNNIGDAIQIVGVGTNRDRYNSGFNGIHTITAVTPTTVSYNNNWPTSVGVYSGTQAGIHTGFFMIAGNAPNITAITYSDPAVGIATITTAEPHGLSVDNTFKIVGAAQTIYNGTHLVYEKESTTKFSFRFDSPEPTPASYTSGAQVLPVMYGAKGGKLTLGNERLDERQIPLTVGIHTTLSNAAWSATSTTLTLTSSAGFSKGDYVQIDDEIIRISNNFSGNAAPVLRGQLGSRANTHVAGSVVKKIRVLAVEKRRASVLRASGHTFEYMGFGPGNYSTSFPEKQARILTREEKFLSQAGQDNGGQVIYTGVNDTGDFFIGNKSVNSQDGTESTFNIPIPTITGTDSDTATSAGRLDVIFDSVNIREGLIVDGNNNTTVRLNAPTTVTEKLTVTSTEGAEFHSIDITGGLSPSRTITYSAVTPTSTGTIGDLIYKANPEYGGFVGWTYTPQGWKQFGLVSTERDTDQLSLSLVGVGSTSADRVGTSNGIDVRGNIVADQLWVTGITTVSGSTIFTDVTLGQINVSTAATMRRLDIYDTSNPGQYFGELNVTGVSTFKSDVNWWGSSNSTELTWDKSDNSLNFEDGISAKFGDSSDLTIWHNNDNSHITDSGTGALFLEGDVVAVRSANGALTAIHATQGQGVNLYWNNDKKIETANTGAVVTGILTATSFVGNGINLTNTGSTLTNNPSSGTHRLVTTSLTSGVMTTSATDPNMTWNYATNTLTVDGLFVTNDVHFDGDTAGRDIVWDASDNSLNWRNNTHAKFGINTDLTIWSDGTNSTIQQKDGGTLQIDGDVINIRSTGGGPHNHIQCLSDGASGYVKLYHNNTWRVHTTSTGVSINGVLSGNGSGLTNINLGDASHTGVIQNARLPNSISSDITGTATNANFVNVDEQNNSANYQILFCDNNSHGFQRPYIDTDNSHLTWNPNTATLAGISQLTASSLSGAGGGITGINATNISSGTLNVNRIGSSGTRNSTRYLRGDNTWSQIAAADLTGTISVNRLGSSGTRNGSNFLAGDNSWKTVTVAVGSYSNSSNDRVITSSGGDGIHAESGLTFNGTNLSCVGNITAFTSDIRLKTNLEPIENALDRVSSLNGFTYNFNQTAVDELGFESETRHSGVSAQDVQSVLPEAVAPAPGKPDKYLTVYYDKLVPLLIEAIKELKAEVDELKSKVN